MARGTDKAKGSRVKGRRNEFVASCVAAAVLIAMATGWYYADRYWPYRYRNVEPLLESVFASKIKIDKYHRTYFPRPGFVASGLTLRRNSAPDLPPVGSAKDLIVQGSWLDLLLLRRRVQLVDVVGLQVVIPPVGSRANKEDFPPGSSADFAGPTTAVEKFHIHDSELDIMRTNGSRYAFPVHGLVIRNLVKGQAIRYKLDMQNAQPGGRIQSTGSFGPVTPENLGGTKLSGEFTFAPVNLGDVGELRGTMSAKGKFSGSLDSVEVEADSETPDFAVSDGRATQVTGYVQSTVNGLNGNMVLHRIEVKTGETTVKAAGTIMSAPDTPKVTNLDITVSGGRAQDVLRPFLKAKSPITGAVSLHGHARVDGARGGEAFLHRLHVEGGFSVPQERLTNKTAETSLSQLSERAQGAKQAKGEEDASDTDVMSSLQGDVGIRDGVVSTQKLTFGIPGAEADLNGTFNLHTSNVHLVGNLKMESDISHVTTGFKSILLKPLAPFFKKKSAGAVIPIAVTGSPGQYKVGQDILHTK